MDAVKNQQMHGMSTGFSQSGFGGSHFMGTNAHTGKSTANLRPLMGAGGAEGHFETTNQRNFKNYQIKHRPQTCKPKAEAVRTAGGHGHFKTSYKNEFKKMKYKPPAVDMIPYP